MPKVIRKLFLTAVVLPAMALVACSAVKDDRTVEGGTVSGKTQVDVVQRKDLAAAVYEVVFDKGTNSLFVAGNESGKGVIFRLDPANLQVKQKIELDYGAFSLAINAKAGVLYIGHTLDQAVTAIDTKSGEKLTDILFDDEQTESRPRQLALAPKERLLFVGGEGDSGVIWVLDSQTLALKQILQNAGGLGLSYQSDKNVLYSSGKNFLKVFDVNTFNIKTDTEITDVANSLLLNLTVDKKRGLMYVSDFNAERILVIDVANMNVKRQVATAAGPVGILYNPKRDELYVANRVAGKVSVYSGDNLLLLKQFELAQFPNSLAIDSSGQVLYVSVKKDVKNNKVKDAVVRIKLADK